MRLLDRLFGAKSKAPSEDPNALILYVKGKKCGAITRVRIDRRNELSRDDDDNFVVRKGVVDSVCFGTVEIEMRFDEHHRELSRNITGGEFVTKADYDAWLQQQPK